VYKYYGSSAIGRFHALKQLFSSGWSSEQMVLENFSDRSIFQNYCLVILKDKIENSDGICLIWFSEMKKNNFEEI